MRKLFCPSMMCADYSNLKEEIERLEQADIDIFHLDVMDGQFVPNFGMGLQDIAYICKHSSKPVDVHLMITNPYTYIEMFITLGADIVYIHPDAGLHPLRTLMKIKDLGAKAGVALDPEDSADSVGELLPYADYVLIMGVNAGFAGQNYLDITDEKIMRIHELQKKNHYRIILDGACSPERIRRLGAAGVDGFVLGTSALFGKSQSYKEIVTKLRA